MQVFKFLTSKVGHPSVYRCHGILVWLPLLTCVYCSSAAIPVLPTEKENLEACDVDETQHS